MPINCLRTKVLSTQSVILKTLYKQEKKGFILQDGNSINWYSSCDDLKCYQLTIIILKKTLPCYCPRFKIWRQFLVSLCWENEQIRRLISHIYKKNIFTKLISEFKDTNYTNQEFILKILFTIFTPSTPTKGLDKG